MSDSKTENPASTENRNQALFIRKSYLVFLALKYLSPAEYGSGVYVVTESDKFGNIGEHGLTAGAYAEILAELFNLDDQQSTKVVKAAILHDAGKQQEIEALNTLSNTPRTEITNSKISEAMGKTAQYLQQIGIDDEIIRLAGANVPPTALGPETIEQEIVWYVDAMLSGTEAMNITTRMNKAIETGDNSNKLSRNQIIHSKAYPGGETLHEVQINVGEKLSQKFVNKLKLDIDSGSFPYHLKKILDRKILNFDPVKSYRQYISDLVVSSKKDPEKTFEMVEMFTYLTILLDRFHLQSLSTQLFDDLVARPQDIESE